MLSRALLGLLTALALMSQINCASARLPVCCGKKAPPPVVVAPPKKEECPLVLEIYFDYDRSVLKPEALALLDTYWACLSKQLAGKDNWYLEIGGHTDEWGKSAYNVALGTRRADSVQAYFLGRGVTVEQMQRVTYGESVPQDPTHSPNAWAHNRRATVTVKFR